MLEIAGLELSVPMTSGAPLLPHVTAIFAADKAPFATAVDLLQAVAGGDFTLLLRALAAPGDFSFPRDFFAYQLMHDLACRSGPGLTEASACDEQCCLRVLSGALACHLAFKRLVDALCTACTRHNGRRVGRTWFATAEEEALLDAVKSVFDGLEQYVGRVVAHRVTDSHVPLLPRLVTDGASVAIS